MRKLIIISVLLLSGVAFGQNYIPYTGYQPMQVYQQPPVNSYQPIKPMRVYTPPVQKYNPMNNTWQTTYPDSELKYNPLAKEPSEKWQYAPKNAQPVYNPFNNAWEFPK